MLWQSSDLMLLLISLVGEERSLGPGNVMQLEDGGKLLTDPAGMLLWTLPIWFASGVQITAAISLAWLWWNKA